MSLVVEEKPKDHSRLTFENYLRTPELTSTLDDMLSVSEIRINLLKDIENRKLVISNDPVATIEEKEQKRTREYLKIKELHKLTSEQDNCSHFILMLAAAMNSEFKMWFIPNEIELFKHRIKNTDINDYHIMLTSTQFETTTYEKMIVDFPNHKEWLEEAKGHMHKKYPHENVKAVETICLVPIEMGYSMLKKKRLFLYNGFVYISQVELDNVYIAVFRDLLESHVNIISDCLPGILKDERIKEILEAVVAHRQTTTYQIQTKGSSKVNIGNIDKYYEQCYPPCMKHLHKLLRTQHKLMHYGRLVYILFLKGIGMSLDDTMALWKSEFTKVMDTGKFEKEYAYNVRHGYGKEGKKADYTPWGCDKLIKFEDTASEPHGCPFKIYNSEGIIKFLDDYKLTQEEIKNILDAKNQKLYQICCLRLWEYTHKGQVGDNIGNHPNAYFDSCIKLEKKSEASTTKPEKMEDTVKKE